MNRNHWLSTTIFAMGLLTGLFVAHFLTPYFTTEVHAQTSPSKKVMFVKTATMVNPSGKADIERWQDAETKVVCYAAPTGLSCVK